MMYHLRDKNGNLKMSLSNTRASEIMNGVPGFFRKAKYNYTGEVTVFELTEDRSLRIGDIGYTLFLWSGDRLIPVKD